MSTGNRTTLLSFVSGILLSTAFLGGCNTVEGVGRDIEGLGDAIEDQADETRDERRRN